MVMSVTKGARLGSFGSVESVNFDRAADYYDATRALPAATMEALTAMLAAELSARQPSLEIGVGTGRMALPLRDRGITLAGLDISGAMLARLVANAGGDPPVPLVQADATRLPLAAGSFGSVLAVHVLHLIPDWRAAVDEVLRVLRPGGALFAGIAGAGHRTPREAAGAAGTGHGVVRIAAPWRDAVREALRRHGIARTWGGVTDPEEVAGYVRGRAAVRALPPVPIRRTRTLRATVERIEQQQSAWMWPYTQEQARAAGGDIRSWAERENIPLDAEYPVAGTVRWWAFELPRLAEFPPQPAERLREVAGAGDLARIRHGQPAQRGVRALRRRGVGPAGGQEVPQVRVLMGGLALAGRYLADHRVPQPGVRPRDQVGEPALLRRLAERDLQGVALPRVAVPSDLQPPPLPRVPAKQHPPAVRMHDQRGRGEMQRQRPQPRILLGRGQPPHPLNVRPFGLIQGPVPGQPSVAHALIMPPRDGRQASHAVMPSGHIDRPLPWIRARP